MLAVSRVCSFCTAFYAEQLAGKPAKNLDIDGLLCSHGK